MGWCSDTTMAVLMTRTQVVSRAALRQELIAALETVSGKYSEIRFLAARLVYLHFTVWMKIGLP